MGGWTLKGEHEWSECSVQFDGDGSYHTIYEPGRRLPVAFVIGTGRHWRDNEAEDTATARLIASAPDLLEALTALYASYKALADSGDAGNWRLEDTDEGQQTLAAIRKVTGKA
jgi:hypothetical protein